MATSVRTIGVCNGGGDCPGLNAVIRAVVRTAKLEYGWRVIGVTNGFNGLIWPEQSQELTFESIRGILPRGGTILGTTNRGNSFAFPVEENGRTVVHDYSGRCVESLKKFGIEGLVVIGGDGTLTIAHEFSKLGVKVVGVPKTIDNDLMATEFTFGFDTALHVATDAIDRPHTTAESHHRVMVIEVMGRDAGWIALHSGLAGGADVILIPEVPFDIDQVAETIRQRHARGRYFSIVVAAEGAKFAGGNETLPAAGLDEFGHARLGGIGSVLAQEIEKRTGFESRSVVLGHIQRGGSPSAFDRVLATRYGLGAIDMVHRGEFGKMAALRGNKIISIPLAEAIASNRKVDKEILDAATGILDKLDYNTSKIS